MQQTHLNPGFDVFPNAPVWLPQYAPMPPRDMSEERVADNANDDGNRVQGGDGGNDSDGGQGSDDGGSGNTEVLYFDEN
jgi:hypothetical protein